MMRRAGWWLFAVMIFVARHEVAAVAPPAAEKPFGIGKRIPWTTSRVVGSPDPPLPYRVKRVFERLKIVCPIAVAHEPGTDSLIIIHQLRAWTGTGRILRIKDDPETDRYTVLRALDRIAYGLAFHPEYKKNGYLYVGSNGPTHSDRKTTRVSRYTVSRKPPFTIEPGSEKVIIEWASDGHNGGDLAFGKDGMLYVSSGDGTSDSDTNHAGQDVGKLLAKVLRIDVEHPDPGKAYSVPADNPFVKDKRFRPETWAYGFRNPWRLHIDRATGDLWVGNNGQDLWEQVYLVERGANYGWSVVEGGHPFYPDRKRGPTPISKPIIDHPHSEMRSLTGGVVYRGSKLPDLVGAYVYGDWSTGRIWGVRHKAGKVVWHRELARTTLQITGFGLDSHGELLIADHGGGFYQLEPAPKEKGPRPFPTRLSETGLFASVKDHRPHPGLIPYSVNAPLWSDGADKERFLALPGDSGIEFTNARGWNFSDGAVLVKTFLLQTTAGPKRIETRLLTRQLGQWAGYSYRWNAAQTDAELVGSAGLDQVYEVLDAQAPSGKRKQTWHYPSRTECMVCHSRAANYVLGMTTLQMNKVHDYGKVSDNQLRTLEHLGVFKVDSRQHLDESKDKKGRITNPSGRLLEALGRKPTQPLGSLHKIEQELAAQPRTTTLLPRPAWRYEKLVDPQDARQPLELRARSYLHANCSQCHVDAGGGNAQIDVEFTTTAARMKMFGVKPLHDTFGVAGAQIVKPGDPERSTLYLRLARRGPGQMPPLATSVVDRQAADLLREWISRMKETRAGR
jgi:glucose/arabinose dehydrogenase